MQWAKKNEFTNLSETAALDLIQNLDAKAEDVIQIAYGAKNAVVSGVSLFRLPYSEKYLHFSFAAKSDGQNSSFHNGVSGINKNSPAAL